MPPLAGSRGGCGMAAKYLVVGALILLAATESQAQVTRRVLRLQDVVTTGFEGGSTQATIHGTLNEKDGTAAGTFDAFLVATLAPAGGATLRTTIIMATATLANGSVAAQGSAQIGDNQPPFNLAIVGGTGAYRGATGELRVRPGGAEGNNVTIVLKRDP